MRVKRYIKAITNYYREQKKYQDATEREDKEWTRRKLLDRTVRFKLQADGLRKELRENGYNDEMIERLDDIARRLV